MKGHSFWVEDRQRESSNKTNLFKERIGEWPEIFTYYVGIDLQSECSGRMYFLE